MMNEEIELAPCPWCGEKPEFDLVSEIFRFLHGAVIIHCTNKSCPIKPQGEGFDNEAQAAAAWNRRFEK